MKKTEWDKIKKGSYINYKDCYAYVVCKDADDVNVLLYSHKIDKECELPPEPKEFVYVFEVWFPECNDYADWVLCGDIKLMSKDEFNKTKFGNGDGESLEAVVKEFYNNAKKFQSNEMTGLSVTFDFKNNSISMDIKKEIKW